MPSPPPSHAHGTSAPLPGRAAGITLSILMGETHLLRKDSPQSSRQMNPRTPEHMPCSFQVAGSQAHWVPRAHSDWHRVRGCPAFGGMNGIVALLSYSFHLALPHPHPPTPQPKRVNLQKREGERAREGGRWGGVLAWPEPGDWALLGQHGAAFLRRGKMRRRLPPRRPAGMPCPLSALLCPARPP